MIYILDLTPPPERSCRTPPTILRYTNYLVHKYWTCHRLSKTSLANAEVMSMKPVRVALFAPGIKDRVITKVLVSGNDNSNENGTGNPVRSSLEYRPWPSIRLPLEPAF